MSIYGDCYDNFHNIIIGLAWPPATASFVYRATAKNYFLDSLKNADYSTLSLCMFNFGNR